MLWSTIKFLVKITIVTLLAFYLMNKVSDFDPSMLPDQFNAPVSAFLEAM